MENGQKFSPSVCLLDWFLAPISHELSITNCSIKLSEADVCSLDVLKF